LELMSFFLLLVVLIRSLSLSLVPVVVKTTNNRNNSSHVWDYCPFGCLLLLLSLVFVYLTNTEPDFEREGGKQHSYYQRQSEFRLSMSIVCYKRWSTTDILFPIKNTESNWKTSSSLWNDLKRKKIK
jgi:hypothetical protein